MTKVSNQNQKSNLEIFYQGFNGFQSLWVEPGYVILKMPSSNYVADAMVKANKRISDLMLPLQVERPYQLSKTFIVKEIANA